MTATETATETPQTHRAPTSSCAHLTKAGAPCTMPPRRGTNACVNHSPDAHDIQLRAASASVAARRRRRDARIERRERTAADWIAVALEEKGREIAEAVAQAAAQGDVKAAMALWERVYGKPVERVEAVQLDVDLRSLSDAQLEEVRQRLIASTNLVPEAPQTRMVTGVEAGGHVGLTCADEGLRGGQVVG